MDGFARFFTPEDRAAGTPETVLRIARDEGRYETEGERVRKDGTHIWVHVVIDPIWDQDGKLLDIWKQWSRPSGILILPDDTMYVADSESWGPDNPGWRKGIRIGSAKDGVVTAFIPDPLVVPGALPATSISEGVATDADGVIYGAEVGSKSLKRYVKISK